MRTFPMCVAVLAMTAMAAAAAPQSSTQAKRPAAASASHAAAQPKLTDAQLEAAIKARFAKSTVHKDGITVRVQGGVAHITGKTDVIQRKGAATRMAHTAGALVVDNRIEVSEAAKNKASGNLEEGRRRVQVKRGDARSDARPPK